MGSSQLSPRAAATLRMYYERVSKGDFMGVASCLTPDVLYVIPGQPGLLPFAGEWVGREQVLRLFRAFGDAFWITHLLQTATIYGENEVFEFNDEAFKVKSTGRYYRVGVVHRIQFSAEGLIQSLHNTHDTYVARQAFSSDAPIVEPLPALASPREGAPLDERRAEEVVTAFLGSSAGEIAKRCTADVALISPGNPKTLPFSGYWREPSGVVGFHTALESVVQGCRWTVDHVLANGGVVAAVGKLQGTLGRKSEAVVRPWACMVQLDEGYRIDRIAYYLDTDPLAQLMEA